jgi:hypothetical protein
MMGRLSHDQEQFFYSFHLDDRKIARMTPPGAAGVGKRSLATP